MRILLLLRDEADLRVERLAILVEVPVFPTRHIGVVGMAEGDGQAPGTALRFVRRAGVVVELLRGVEGDLVVILHLVGDLGDAGAGDRAQIVVPPVDALAGLAIVRRPAEIGGIDVGGQPLLETVQLVRPDEMHLSRQAGVVAGGAQMMRIGRDRRGEFGCVVVDARAGRQLAAHEGRPARRAERRCGIIVPEPCRPRRKRLQVWRMQEFGGTIRKKRAVELVDHDDEEIRPARHRCAFCLASFVSR